MDPKDRGLLSKCERCGFTKISIDRQLGWCDLCRMTRGPQSGFHQRVWALSQRWLKIYLNGVPRWQQRWGGGLPWYQDLLRKLVRLVFIY
jgi:hypothetical protein